MNHLTLKPKREEEEEEEEEEERRRLQIRTAANKNYIPMTIKMQIFNEEEKEKKALVAMLYVNVILMRKSPKMRRRGNCIRDTTTTHLECKTAVLVKCAPHHLHLHHHLPMSSISIVSAVIHTKGHRCCREYNN